MATIDAQDLRRAIGRFRVLIAVRANAGKTTILQKIDAAIVRSSIKRALKKNLRTCKDLSCNVHTTKLEERIHVIWYCIPMDDSSQTFQRSEEKFFLECDTGHDLQFPWSRFSPSSKLYVRLRMETSRSNYEGYQEKNAQRGLPSALKNCSQMRVLNELYKPENRARPKYHVRLQNLGLRSSNDHCYFSFSIMTIQELAPYATMLKRTGMTTDKIVDARRDSTQPGDHDERQR
ncbi:uncharacterized protein F5891DRAFT_978615 [Suillus fuscotomentosus]|uniref:Uncharacterized protein n=1 Tax=Suillus fuscotomentosus TaxID=1912939 RepID=A0AAD4ED00_9AGAM|nr:uncharacterized protein F5891DRAFT_978615 [Suillus fuscotomentosus]KAG1902734.1 hypothetical protein F5891DRAFT_978615 [Suillus fuscotomentosus]